jgi:hypothetical protein
VEVTQLRVDRAEDGLFLTAQIKLELPTIMEDALNKGVALFFVAEAELLRDRWYWYDRKLSVATKYIRWPTSRSRGAGASTSHPNRLAMWAWA